MSVSDLASKQKTWRRTVVVHIEPLNDRIEHDTLTRACVCKPEISEVDEQGGRGIFIRHHALDGRD